jgi:hypothetical protein
MSVTIITKIEAKNPETSEWESIETTILQDEKQANLLANYPCQRNIYPNIPLKIAAGIPEDSPAFGQKDPMTLVESFLTLEEINQPDYWTHTYFVIENTETCENKYKASYTEVCKSFLEEVVPKMYNHLKNGMTQKDVRVLIYIK